MIKTAKYVNYHKGLFCLFSLPKRPLYCMFSKPWWKKIQIKVCIGSVRPGRFTVSALGLSCVREM